MNFVVVCLHCLDMRDFHSHLKETPFLDSFRKVSVFIPMGRAQGHNQRDSLNAEMTGLWSARYCDSALSAQGYVRPRNFWYPKTLIEYFRDAGYYIFTRISLLPQEDFPHQTGTFAATEMKNRWLKNEPERLWQFDHPEGIGLDGILDGIGKSTKFYAHIFLRQTHRPWDQPEGLCALAGRPPADWPDDAYAARRAALEHPDEFAALRRRGLAKADQILARIYAAVKHRDDVVFVVYSNHGEVFDHFRYQMTYKTVGYSPGNSGMIVGVSHGPYPYEVLYANMQMWKIPGIEPKVMSGIWRLIDLAPTILDIAAIKHPRFDGESMIPDFQNKNVFPLRNRYAESGHAVSMVREDGYKLISTGVRDSIDRIDLHQLAVFDLRSDPYEYVNLIDTSQGADVLSWAIETHSKLEKLPKPEALQVPGSSGE